MKTCTPRWQWMLSLVVALTAFSATAHMAWAEEDELAKEEQAAQPDANKTGWNEALRERYNLTDADIKKLQDAGLNNPQMAMTAQLAKSSGKSLDDIIKMRQEQRMGWGKIAKELGVHPGEVGKAVSGMRHEVREGRFKEKTERKEDRRENAKERKEKREERKEERRVERHERREDRKEAREAAPERKDKK